MLLRSCLQTSRAAAAAVFGLGHSNFPHLPISASRPFSKASLYNIVNVVLYQEDPQYYDPATLESPPEPTELPSSSGRLVCTFGMDGSKRGAMDYIAEDILVYPAANTLQTLNVRMMVQAQMQVGRELGCVSSCQI
jgi:hypothetical protein